MKCPNCNKEIEDGKLFVVGADLQSGEVKCSKCVDADPKEPKKKSSKK